MFNARKSRTKPQYMFVLGCEECHCTVFTFFLVYLQYFAAQGQWISPDLGEVQYAQLLWGKIAAISNTKTENDVSTLRCSCKQLLMPAGEENIHPSTWSWDIQY